MATHNSAAKLSRSDSAKLLLSMVFISMVFLPLIRMFAYMDGKSIQKVVSSPVFTLPSWAE